MELKGWKAKVVLAAAVIIISNFIITSLVVMSIALVHSH
jgi:hypothetical protein